MSVCFYGCVTLDGYLADKNHGLDWLNETGSVEETGYDRFYSEVDITLMGRRTFREIAALENPGSFYPTTQNYVFTHGKDPLPQGFTAVEGDVVDFVRSLDPDKKIWVIGGNTILAPLLEADMVDSMTVQIAPALLGDGIPLFTQPEGLKRFRLEEVRRYGQFGELVYNRI